MTPKDIKPIGSLRSADEWDSSILLGNRFLCRGGSCLINGRTGIGKSSAIMQMALHFAVGRGCFGIKPSRGWPLTSLIIQAENDDGDLAEMRDGILAGLPWEECEKEAARKNVYIVTINDATGHEFCAQLERAAQHVMADLVWGDPLLSFMGGDVMRQADTTEFLRGGLQPILSRNDFGLIMCHHEPKPPRQDGRNSWSDADHAYAGSGSSELANWARGVLSLTPVPDAAGAFKLIGAKRGSRLGWRNHLGSPTSTRYLRHAADGTIHWEEIDQPEPVKKEPRHTRDDLLAHVPKNGTIPKSTLIENASKKTNAKPIGRNTVRAYLDDLIHNGVVFEHEKARPGTNALKLISRQPPPSSEGEQNDAKSNQKTKG